MSDESKSEFTQFAWNVVSSISKSPDVKYPSAKPASSRSLDRTIVRRTAAKPK